MGYVNASFAPITLTGSVTNVYSPSINKSRSPGVSIQAVTPAGATSVGKVQVYGSNDNVNFSPITNATVAISSGANVAVIDVSTFCMWVQLAWIPTSGPGTDQMTVSYTFPLYEP